MFLLVGLGNPGPGHAGNRHNIGFMAVDEIIRRHGFGPEKARFQARVAEGTIAGVKALAIKPLTYMNLSGQSVGTALRFLKLAPSDVIVIHDELDLLPGKLRVKIGGGAGGHNGLKSLDAHIGREYKRVRLGIGHPGDRDAVTNWVLQDFAKADGKWLEPLLDAVASAFPLLIAGDDAGFMNKIALATKKEEANGV
jgi:PTH1 family peptidyl-tRNA hydrolase